LWAPGYVGLLVLEGFPAEHIGDAAEGNLVTTSALYGAIVISLRYSVGVRINESKDDHDFIRVRTPGAST